MAGSATTEEIEIIVEDIGGGGGKEPPAGGDGGDDGERRRRPRKPSPRRYETAVTLIIISVLMFFMALSSAFIVLKSTSNIWVPVHLPPILWLNTAILLASSAALELARRKLSTPGTTSQAAAPPNLSAGPSTVESFAGAPALGAESAAPIPVGSTAANIAAFQKWWLAGTALGVLFLLGQLVAWREMAAEGVYVASTQASSFFYIFTAAHGAHIIGGICALLYVATRNFDKARVTRVTAAEITSHFWHFMDGLWIFLLALLYFGK